MTKIGEYRVRWIHKDGGDKYTTPGFNSVEEADTWARGASQISIYQIEHDVLVTSLSGQQTYQVEICPKPAPNWCTVDNAPMRALRKAVSGSGNAPITEITDKE